MKYMFIICMIFMIQCNHESINKEKSSIDYANKLNDYAIREFQKSILINNDSVNMENIIDSISLAIKLSPSNSNFYKNKAMILYHYSKVEDAIKVLESFDNVEYEYDPMINRMLGKYYDKMSKIKYDEIIKYYQNKLLEDPTDIWIKCEIISLQKYTISYEYAINEIEKLKNEYPKNQTILNYIEIIKSDI